MAREGKKAITDVVEYVPEIDNNRDDPDPFVVDIRPMLGEDLRELERSMGDFTGAKVNFTERAQKKAKEMFGKYVPGVRGYAIAHRLSGEMIRPRTGAGLYQVLTEHGDEHEQTIISDILEAVKNQSKLRAGLRETLRSRSEQASTAPASGGTAAGGVDEKKPPSPS